MDTRGIEKLNAIVSNNVFPAGRYRRGDGDNIPIVVSHLEDGKRIALLSLFTRATPEGVQLGHDQGDYRVFGFRVTDSDGEPGFYSDSFGGWGNLPLYEIAGMQTTQKGFPERVEGRMHIARYLVGDASSEYDLVVAKVAALSVGQDRLAMSLESPRSIVSLLYDGSLGQRSSGFARVAAERTNVLDALGMPVYRASSLELVDR